jgi:hypothetical protein
MVHVNRPFISAKQKLIRCGPDHREYHTLFGNRAYKFSFLVKNKQLSIITQNQEESSELRNHTLFDCLLDHNLLLKIEVALEIVPQLDARLLYGNELHRVVKVHLSCLASRILIQLFLFKRSRVHFCVV